MRPAFFRGGEAEEHAEMSPPGGSEYDVLIIGTGFAGSVTALRLTR